MLHSILRQIIRNFFRNLSYSLTTLLGLVVGLTAAILVFLWVKFELGYDRYHRDNERVYTIMFNDSVDGVIETEEETSAPLTEFLSSNIAEVEAVTRFDNTRALLGAGTKSIQKVGAYVDAEYFRVFSPDIIAGSKTNPMPGNHSVAVSQTLANLLFNGDALGKIITIDLKKEFKVSAIFADFPQNSSLKNYQFLLPFHAKARAEDEWQNYFVKLSSTEAKTKVESDIDRQLKKTERNKTSLLFPLTDWRLHWNFENGQVSGGRIVYVVIFGVTAIFILIMACVNYVNIATARAVKRGREVGVRKMTGASQGKLMRQFMTETLATTFIATILALFFALLALPLFNELTGTPLEFKLSDPKLLGGLFFISAFAGLLAGSYPAFLLSSLKPALVLKGNVHSALTGATLRKGLVTFQFTLSIILIFGAVVLRQQTNFLLTRDLGYDKNNVINVWLDRSKGLPLDQFRSEIVNHSAILSAGYGGASPMEVNGSAEARWSGQLNDTPILINGASADHDLLPTLKFEFIEGRNFSRDFNDSSNFVITQHAAEVLGLKNPVGQTIRYNMFGDQQGKIIGVIKDFQNEDIHVNNDPVIFTLGPDEYLFNLFIRYDEGKLDDALAHVKTVFNKLQPGIPIDYSFLDGDFENQFYQEKMLGNISIWFTVIAVVIACLGLFGLTMFNTERRTKEIGIRKVLGASVSQLSCFCSGIFPNPFSFRSFLPSLPRTT
jgi:putative ABC transport system permease protein